MRSFIRPKTPERASLFFPMAALLAALALGAAETAHAEPNLFEKQNEALDKANSAPDYGFRAGSVVVAPIPFKNPVIGGGLALGTAYLFNNDADSNASIVGIGGFKSNNGSLGYGATVNLAWNNNRWIFKSFFGEADLNYDIFVVGLPIPIRQKGTFARMSLAYGVTPKLSFGPTLRYLNTNISPANWNGPNLPPPYSLDANLELLSAGIIANWDLRDDTIYPTSGLLLNFEAFHGITLEGIELEYSKAFVNFSHFLALGDRGVLATRLSTCAASNETPFFDLCSLGGTDNMRGFSATQYFDQRLLSAQVEYRRELTGRVGAVAFAGAGMTGESFGTIDDGGVHSAAGFGLRVRISKKFPVDFSIDASLNNEDEKLVYIYVGQRF